MSPLAFYLRNHSASELHRAELGLLPSLARRPQFANKGVYAKWCHDARTQHVFYTLAEPEQPGVRSSKENRIKYLHGIVADYDGDAGAIQGALPLLNFPEGRAPTWATTTFSGKARLVWAFERAVPVFSPEVLERFLLLMKKELRLGMLLPGLDEGALLNPHTPYELGTDWRQPWGDPRVPQAVVFSLIHEASAKAKWRTGGPELPLEAVAAEVERRWPGRWRGEFAEGARGVRFWDAAADNPTGCTLRAQGVQAWTGEGKFIPWPELLGGEFMKRHRVNRIGGAIDGTYFDGQVYWQRDDEGLWRDLTCEAVKRHLTGLFGLSPEARKGQLSEVAEALMTIERLQRVDGAFPCLFVKETVVRDCAQKYLNISRRSPLPHTPGIARAWGDGFPWLAAYFEGLFDERQREVFMAWMAHFYSNASRGTPRKGHALFIAGPPATGKTLLSQRIVGGLMGGFEDASEYILGRTQFNESLFYAPVWAIDDAVAAANPKRHEEYSQMTKKVVANPYQVFHPKFRKAVSFRFNGRLVVTLNTDPKSMAMLPQMDGTILDKLVGLVARPPGVSFAGADAAIERELPYFADWLAAFVVPEWLQTNPDQLTRFGHDAYMHSTLLESARDAGEASTFTDLLDKWRTHYFRGCDEEEWTGSQVELWLELNKDEVLEPVVSRVIPSKTALTQGLQLMLRQDVPWLEHRRTAEKRFWVVKREAR